MDKQHKTQLDHSLLQDLTELLDDARVKLDDAKAAYAKFDEIGFLSRWETTESMTAAGWMYHMEDEHKFLLMKLLKVSKAIAKQYHGNDVQVQSLFTGVE